MIFRGLKIGIFFAFVCLNQANANSLGASSWVQIKSENKSCIGSWISNNGYLLTNLECLRNCIDHQYVNCALSVEGQATLMKIEFLGKGVQNFSVGELIHKTHSELVELKKSIMFQGDGDFAILKLKTKNPTACVPINESKIVENQTLFLQETADKITVQKPFETALHSPNIEMLKKIWNWTVRNPQKYLVHIYSTPYSLILSKPAHKFTKGGAVLTLKNRYVGPAVNFENEVGYVKVLKSDKIFEQVYNLLGYSKAIEYFNCIPTVF